MDLSSIENWGTLMNLTSFLLWGITLVYLIRKEPKDGEESFRRFMKFPNDDFANEWFSKLLMKQSDIAFKRISDSIVKERQLLCDLITSGVSDKSPMRDKIEDYNVKESVKTPPTISRERGKDQPASSSVYSEALRLAGSGMDVANISQKLMLPRGEVELLIKLRKKSIKLNNNNGDRAMLANKSISTSI